MLSQREGALRFTDRASSGFLSPPRIARSTTPCLRWPITRNSIAVLRLTQPASVLLFPPAGEASYSTLHDTMRFPASADKQTPSTCVTGVNAAESLAPFPIVTSCWASPILQHTTHGVVCCFFFESLCPVHKYNCSVSSPDVCAVQWSSSTAGTRPLLGAGLARCGPGNQTSKTSYIVSGASNLELRSTSVPAQGRRSPRAPNRPTPEGRVEQPDRILSVVESVDVVLSPVVKRGQVSCSCTSLPRPAVRRSSVSRHEDATRRSVDRATPLPGPSPPPLSSPLSLRIWTL